jgi:hypothetical protein
MRRWRAVIASGMLILALAHIMLWINAQRGRYGSATMVVPIAPGREVRVNIWKPVKDNTSFIMNGALAHDIDRPMTVVVWYHHTWPVRASRVGSMELPTWPLLLIAAALTAGGVWAWPRDKRYPSNISVRLP